MNITLIGNLNNGIKLITYKVGGVTIQELENGDVYSEITLTTKETKELLRILKKEVKL